MSNVDGKRQRGEPTGSVVKILHTIFTSLDNSAVTFNHVTKRRYVTGPAQQSNVIATGPAQENDLIATGPAQESKVNTTGPAQRERRDATRPAQREHRDTTGITQKRAT